VSKPHVGRWVNTLKSEPRKSLRLSAAPHWAHSSECGQALARGAQPVDAQLDHVPVDQKARRLLPHADAGGSTRGDDVAGQERHELADVTDERGHVEDEILGRAGL